MTFDDMEKLSPLGVLKVVSILISPFVYALATKPSEMSSQNSLVVCPSNFAFLSVARDGEVNRTEQFVITQCLDNNFWSDPCRVAHCDDNSGQLVHIPASIVTSKAAATGAVLTINWVVLLKRIKAAIVRPKIAALEGWNSNERCHQQTSNLHHQHGAALKLVAKVVGLSSNRWAALATNKARGSGQRWGDKAATH